MFWGSYSLVRPLQNHYVPRWREFFPHFTKTFRFVRYDQWRDSAFSVCAVVKMQTSKACIICKKRAELSFLKIITDSRLICLYIFIFVWSFFSFYLLFRMIWDNIRDQTRTILVESKQVLRKNIIDHLRHHHILSTAKYLWYEWGSMFSYGTSSASGHF